MKAYRVENSDIVIPIPTSYHDCRKLIRSDYYRHTGKVDGWWNMFLFSIKEPAFAYSIWFRLSAYKGVFQILCKLMRRHYMKKYGLMIAPSTKVGWGLYIGHPCGIVINHTAVIGNNVNLSQFTTIGSNEIKAATIGNNVYIGPNVCIVDDVKIGNNVTRGAGAVVTHDIPDNEVFAGNPAKKINSKIEPGRYINNKWHY